MGGTGQHSKRNRGEEMTDAEKKELFYSLIHEVSQATRSSEEADQALEEVCKILKDKVPHYDWVGFYLTDPNVERQLVLGPYSGAPTEHVRIGFGQGICGQAAETKKTFIVQDVSAETNYLACSPDVRSEIVLPLLHQGEVMGELDIDSHTTGAFSEEDRGFLLKVCYAVSRLLQRAREARKKT
ncbi:GAF domain-containing protein [candidate division WOR-3 bacterium]|uniref:GAF domain-containing protein n=1 Tax=candidate division WOR-3 bacterium TaxID=2052148 RepID=A0A9D5K8X6_UNCW3|nr:GAF domain-containing protein [candidate division WOR-3 bacterium]MBD3364265.1 GAF domain-containing protein [candidate division WOR-3 bacterium]